MFGRSQARGVAAYPGCACIQGSDGRFSFDALRHIAHGSITTSIASAAKGTIIHNYLFLNINL